ncbi:MAG: transposase [Rhodoferax sp.]
MKACDGYWESHVAALNRDGVAVSAYAKRHDLSAAALYYWRRKMKVAAGGGEAVHKVHNAPKFIALRVGDKAAASGASAFTLILEPGVRFEMQSLPAPEWLAAVAHAAGAR